MTFVPLARACRAAVLAAVAATLLLPAARLTAQASKTPGTGADVLEAMRAAYEGKWYHTLTFKQKTTFHRPDGVQEQTWYETLSHTPQGTQLRIDFGDLAAGQRHHLHAGLVVPRARRQARTAARRPATSSCRSSRASTCSRSRRR